MLILAICALLLFGYLGLQDYSDAKSTGNVKALQLQKRGIFISIGVIVSSLLLVLLILPHILGAEFALSSDRKTVLGIAIGFSLLISFIWYTYLSWLDIYEKEKVGTLILTFILAAASSFLVFPIGDLVHPHTYSLDGTFWNDLQYCIVNIGMIEEFVKILPFLIILKLTKAINESYDYILYGGICALGFAAVENSLYLRNTDLFVLNGRAMISTVSHMFDTGIICYSMAMARYKKKNVLVAMLYGYLLASVAHGFYDFWLISEGYQYPMVTIAFFLASIHIFTIMKNNLINISEYFDDTKRVEADRNKFRLFNLLLFIMFGGYVAIYLINGSGAANAFIKDGLLYNSYILVYLAVSFGSINVVNGYVAPIKLGTRFFLPLINRHPNYLGLPFVLKPTTREPLDEVKLLVDLLPLKGHFSKRLVVNQNFNWYYFTPEQYDESLRELGVQIIIRPAKFDRNLKDQKDHIVHVGFIKNEEDINEVELDLNQVKGLPSMLMQYQPTQ
ncbi:PrsW family intramembrane metalloprotease [Owenweeksia hongkongensis]|uniref:PrsW family intramembrane metalloprotease n=1 Tax=Owenweeksia hongkongensis TaxID=253245 RepID=UPI003A95906E